MNTQKNGATSPSLFREMSVAEWLELTPAEESLVDTGLILSAMMTGARKAHHLSPTEVEERVGLKAGQVVELEGAVGLDFGVAFHVLYFLGVSPREIGEHLAQVELREEVAA